MKEDYSRRKWIGICGGIAGGLCVPQLAQTQDAFPLKGKVKKTLKLHMIGEGADLKEKFELARRAGFQGVEVSAPGVDVIAASKAIKETGFPVDGSVCAQHWNVRHTDPDPTVRAKALENLKRALHDTKQLGGDTVLLVVGKGEDGPEEEIWKRSVDNIRQAVPLAEELGMIIAIENVWNQFCYDHKGDSNQTADKLAKYCDEFESPHVAMQFDIGNHWKYGATGDWIRRLGDRVVKLDIKGFSREKNTFTKIGEGDLDWKDVRKALTEIGFKGWCAAEVRGGDRDRLKEIAGNVDRVLGLV